MKVLVTGGSGFLGRHVVAELTRRGHQVATLSRGPSPLGATGAHYRYDILAPEARQAAAEASAVVHLAALNDVDGSFERPYDYAQVNAWGCLNLLEGLRASGGMFVLASTQRIYRLSPDPIPEDGEIEPASPYAYSKLVAELWCEQYARLLGVRAYSARLFSVYGPGLQARGSSGVVAIFVDNAVRGAPLVAHSRMRRDFTDVSDAASGIALILEKSPQAGRTYNVATSIGTSLPDLAKLVVQVVGSDSPLQIADDAEATHHLVAACDRARAELGYQPQTSLEEGLTRYVNWFRTARQAPA